MQTLSENGVLDNISITDSANVNIMIQNLKNPMFPQDKVASALVKIISANPFSQEWSELLWQRFGETEEAKQIIDYFVG